MSQKYIERPPEVIAYRILETETIEGFYSGEIVDILTVEGINRKIHAGGIKGYQDGVPDHGYLVTTGNTFDGVEWMSKRRFENTYKKAVE